MKKTFLYLSIIVGIFTSLNSCKNDFETDLSDIKITSGNADFSNYVSIGNSLTSGYRDGALYIDGQAESYPSIIATQMKKAGGGDFKQPLMQDNMGGFSNLGPDFSGKLILQNINGNLVPVASPAKNALDHLSGTFNNMGVPGAKSFHLLVKGYGNPNYLSIGKANPYFVRFSSSPNASVIEDVVKQKPTFFSLWIGNNDVLSYATSGGSGKNQKGNINPATYGSSDISDPQVVGASIKAILENLKSIGASKGVIANIPDVTSIPFFTRISPFISKEISQQEADAINNSAAFKGLKQILTALGEGDRIQNIKTNNNPILIKDESLKDLSSPISTLLVRSGYPADIAKKIGEIYGQARHTKKTDYILLTAAKVLNTAATNAPIASFNKYGITYPLDSKYVLTSTEISQIETATKEYNAIIKSLAKQYNLAFVDANAKLKELGENSGIKFNGTTYTAEFVTGGVFSLDGVHLTGRGYAIIANEFIKAINSTYSSHLRLVNPNQYSGIKFP